MCSNYITRHKQFVEELRGTTLKVDILQSHQSKMVRNTTLSEEKSVRLQEELEAKFNELFGNFDDSN